MSKPMLLELDDRTLEEKEQDEAAEQDRERAGMGYSDKAKAPMDSNVTMDHGGVLKDIQINVNVMNEMQGIQKGPTQQERSDLKKLFNAVSSGDVSKLNNLEKYLNKTNKKLTSNEYMPHGKTALMTALLHLKNGKNDAVEHLLNIARRMGDLKDLVNAEFRDPNYEGQTALHIAIERRSKHYVTLLLEHGAKVDARACGKLFQPHSDISFYFGELPLSLAACTNQKDIVDLLMENNANIRHTDSLGNTVLHALVMVADNTPDNTSFVCSMYDYILSKDIVQNSQQENLEDIENNQGLTPVKLAAKKGRIQLFDHILQREFQQEESRHLSRKFTEWTYGPVCSSLYDLTSLDTYEKNSVLEIVVYGTEIPNRLEMLEVEPLNMMLEEKWSRFARPVFLFKAVAYIVYLIIFTAICYSHNKRGLEFKVEAMLLIILAIGSICFINISGLIYMCRTRGQPMRHSLLIDGYSGYSDLLFIFQAVLLLICVGLFFADIQEYLAFLVLCLALGWINLLHFLKASKQLGIYSVMIQRMILGDLLHFLLVYSVFLIGFSTAVVSLVSEESSTVLGGAMKNQTEKPSEDSEKLTFCSTTLELFKLTIGMGELEFTEKYRYKYVFYMLLILYIVLTYILLLNMLIALMSKSVEEISVESKRVWKLQRAVTILDLERCVGCIKQTRSGVKRNLGKEEDEDVRWCLRVDEVNWKIWNHKLNMKHTDFMSDTSNQMHTTTPNEEGPNDPLESQKDENETDFLLSS
ncbi:transient receptor potential cation channel subfamily V member 1-like [Trichomycterus rosablanca]|uniref:transient receptor potential cation channel subfamily V member 1-like n=1 Tax=Trichomycterus rosablanca TaxID=2290929 RepID=UPI002F34EF7A